MKRTAKIIEGEIDILEKELGEIKRTCECRLHSLTVYVSSRLVYKKCLACGHSIKIKMDSVEWLEEWEKLGRK